MGTMSTPVLSNTDSNPHQNKSAECPESLPRGVREYSASHLQLFARVIFLPRRSGLHRFPLLRVFLLELRSFLHRIVLQCKRCCYLDGLSVGPAAEDQTISLQPGGRNIRTRACSESIDSFAAARPWATMVDFEVYRDAWVRGANWAESNTCNVKRQTSA